MRLDDGWLLKSDAQHHGPCKEVLLTLGQPLVHPDEQLAAWQEHVAGTEAKIVQAYPARASLRVAAQWQGQRVAIRGMGLSTFDVLRGLTVAQGGVFEAGSYLPSGREPKRILPFQLDGQPPFPKPATETLDALFSPTHEETQAFVEAAAEPQVAVHLISAALIPPLIRIAAAHQISHAAVAEWISREWTDPGCQERASPLETLQQGIAMAQGSQPPSIGYALGQLWRKWQDPWRATFNPSKSSAATTALLVGFSEGLKRYSHGPPVASACELLALVEVGLVDLSCAADPGITTTPNGRTLASASDRAEVSVMVDAVPPALMAQGDLAPLAPNLAAATGPDGTLLNVDSVPVPGLCLLRRLALGSVTAVDTLHDCFGESADRRAYGLRKRILR